MLIRVARRRVRAKLELERRRLGRSGKGESLAPPTPGRTPAESVASTGGARSVRASTSRGLPTPRWGACHGLKTSKLKTFALNEDTVTVEIQ